MAKSSSIRKKKQRFTFAALRQLRKGNVTFGCGKRCYPSKQAAKAGAKRVDHSRADPNPWPMTPYYCRACEYWHFGHEGPHFRRDQ